jgi:tripartite-type tricarboxylate transporter receptor subunit TctC
MRPDMALNQFSYKSLAYKASDFQQIGMLATTSQVLIANANSQLRSVEDVVRQAKAKPGGLAYGSAGTGNSTHLNVEILARHFKLNLTHVPYKGAAPALVGVIGGETQMMSDAVTSAVPQARAGKVVPLLVFGPARIDAFPNVPTAAEVGLERVVAGGWYGLALPAGSPRAVVDRLNAITRDMWNDDTAKAKLDAIYMVPMPDLTASAATAAIEQDAKTWGPLIKDLGVQLD